jgi:hypothetical protein
MGVYPPVVIRAAEQFALRGGPILSLSLRLRFAASPFAIVFLLVLPNPLHVAIGPDSYLLPNLFHPPRFLSLSI